MRKKYIYISLLISAGIYAIADYYCIYNFTFTLLFTIFLIFNLVKFNYRGGIRKLILTLR